jgi:hypothetical protein
MRIRCDTGIQYALVKDVFDPQALKRQVEQQISAAEDRNRRFLEAAARRDIDAYLNSATYAIKKTAISLAQLSLNFDKVTESTGLQPAVPFA